MPPPRRTRPAPADLDDLDRPAPRLTRAAPSDPVLDVATAAPASASTQGRASATPKVKTSFYIEAEVANQARAAWTWTHAHEGHRSFSDFIANAIAREVERVQKKYNDGQPWPPLAAGEIGTGKPIGS